MNKHNNNLFFDPDANIMPRCDIEELKREIKHLKDLQTNQDKEVESLRELLRECGEWIVDVQNYCFLGIGKRFDKSVDLLTHINTAIGESEE